MEDSSESEGGNGLAARARELLHEEDPEVIRQGLTLARLLDHEVRPLLLRELLSDGYPRAAFALAVAAPDERAAFDHAKGVALWALERGGARLEEVTPSGALQKAAELARLECGKRTASALRRTAKLLDADPDAIDVWARALTRVLNVLGFERDDAAIEREVQRRCVLLLDER